MLGLPPEGIGAHDAHDALRRRAKPQFGGGKQTIDDIGRAADSVIDERRLAIRVDDEQRRLALSLSRAKLDVDLGTVIEDLPRLLRRVALDAIAKAQGVDVHSGVNQGRRCRLVLGMPFPQGK